MIPASRTVVTVQLGPPRESWPGDLAMVSADQAYTPPAPMPRDLLVGLALLGFPNAPRELSPLDRIGIAVRAASDEWNREQARRAWYGSEP